MKKVILFLPLLLAGVVLANAQTATKDSLPATKHVPMRFHQQNHQPEFNRLAFNRAKQIHKRMLINYTKEQRAQLKTISEEYQKQLLQLQSNNAITLGEYKSKLAELKNSRKAQVQNILTEEQKQKMAETRKTADINRQAMAAARLEKLKLTLGLDSEQVQKIKEQQQNLRSQLKSIHENNMLLPEQKKDEFKKLVAQHKDDLKSVLTEEQQKILEQKKDEFKNKRKDFFVR